MAVLGGGVLKSWSSTHGSIAMSSGEAEYYAMVKAAAEGLAIQAVVLHLGYDLKLRLWVDATCAKSIASCTGLGKVRHMEVKYLWAQEAHKKRRFAIAKIAGDKNPSDINTKPKSATEMSMRLEEVGGWLVRKACVTSTSPTRTTTRSTSWADASDSASECEGLAE